MQNSDPRDSFSIHPLHAYMILISSFARVVFPWHSVDLLWFGIELTFPRFKILFAVSLQSLLIMVDFFIDV